MRSSLSCAARVATVLFALPSLALADITFQLDTAQVTGHYAAMKVDAIKTAANNWSNLLADTFQLNLTVRFESLGGPLAYSIPTERSFAYSSFRTALSTRATTSDDASALAHLSAGSSFGLLINRTADSPNGAGSAVPYVDANGGINNSFLRLTTANAKALGLVSPGSGLSDGTIVFNSDAPYASSNGGPIPGDAYDLVGVAMHEIGHILGFVSGVDTLDAQTSPLPENSLAYVHPLDLFRYSTLSTASGVIDWTADSRDKFFSLDGGATSIAMFSTGADQGDGQGAGHWKAGLGLGMMSPTLATGQTLSLGTNDARAFDVMGFTLKQSIAVPEPGSLVLGSLGLILIAPARRRIRRVRAS